jgi:hypothetical protein
MWRVAGAPAYGLVGGLVYGFVGSRSVGSWAGCACDDVRCLRARAALRVRLRRHFHVVVAGCVCVCMCVCVCVYILRRCANRMTMFLFSRLNNLVLSRGKRGGQRHRKLYETPKRKETKNNPRKGNPLLFLYSALDYHLRRYYAIPSPRNPTRLPMTAQCALPPHTCSLDALALHGPRASGTRPLSAVHVGAASSPPRCCAKKNGRCAVHWSRHMVVGEAAPHF